MNVVLNMNKDEEIPIVGNYYHFWDDGKTSSSRHYIAKCEEIITCKQAKGILISVPVWNEETNQNDFERVTLYERWQEQVKGHDWIYATETDYFIKISVPEYDENYLYAVRTKWGGWFTIDIQSWWQGGDLDVSGKKFEQVLQDYYDGQYDWESIYVEANKENWNLKNIEVK